MTRPIPESHPLHRLFRGLTEHAFLEELGIGDPRLVGYVSELLARFVPMEGVFPLQDARGIRLREVAAMIAEAEACADADRRREFHRHVGDFTLFWTGVYPEALRPRPAAPTADGLLAFQRQGKHSYYVASTYGTDDAPVLRRLSAEFELCAMGLARVRREWEALPATAPTDRPLLGL